MKKIMNYKIYNWGPILFSTKIKKEEVNKLLKAYKKSKMTYVKELANTIEEEYPFDKDVFSKVIKVYLQVFMTEASRWYNKNLGKKITITHCWINDIKENEFVPMHDHYADFSSVLYLKVNKSTPQLEFKNKFGGPGAITFKYGEKRKLNIDKVIIQPEVNDLLIFPSNLTHLVYPFRSKEKRICISTNYTIS